MRFGPRCWSCSGARGDCPIGLKRRFSLDDEYLEDLKTEIIDAKRLAVDENGTVLVWTRAASQAETASEPRANTEADSQASPLAAISDEGERRQLTVMFCDLVGSTPPGGNDEGETRAQKQMDQVE